MKTLTKLTFSLLTSSILVACSSHHSSSNHTDDTLSNKNVIVKPQAEEKPSQSQAEAKPSQSQAEAKPSQSQAEEKPSQPQAEVKPSQSQAEAKPSQLQAEAKPSQSQAEVKPSQSQAEVKPSQLQAEAKPTQPQAEAKPTQPQATNNNDNRTGVVIVLSGEDPHIEMKTIDLKDPNLSQINVDGNIIKISQPNFNKQGWGEMFGENSSYLYSCCGEEYPDVRFGIYEGGEEKDSYFFYNGNPTTSIPNTGSAYYKGYSTISANVDLPVFEEDDYIKGNAQFNVNFGTKKLVGSLDFKGLSPIQINANLVDNQFTGTAKTDSIPTIATVEGKFYGKNAQELAGLIVDEKIWGGVFGAKKQ